MTSLATVLALIVQMPTITFDPLKTDTNQLDIGQTFSVTVRATGVPLSRTVGLTIDYDPAVLHLDGEAGTPGSYFSGRNIVTLWNGYQTPNPETPWVEGHFGFIASGTGPQKIAGNWSIVSVRFTVMGRGTTKLRLGADDSMVKKGYTTPLFIADPATIIVTQAEDGLAGPIVPRNARISNLVLLDKDGGEPRTGEVLDEDGELQLGADAWTADGTDVSLEIEVKPLDRPLDGSSPLRSGWKAGASPTRFTVAATLPAGGYHWRARPICNAQPGFWVEPSSPTPLQFSVGRQGSAVGISGSASRRCGASAGVADGALLALLIAASLLRPAR